MPRRSPNGAAAAAAAEPTVGYGGYGGGYGGGYSGCGNCGVPAVYTTPAPLYVVNQGPAFEGPGLMVPYHSYAPPVEYAPPPAYPPYAGGYGGGYAGAMAVVMAAVMRARTSPMAVVATTVRM